MKSIQLVSLFSLLLVTNLSCKKSVENTGIVGTWKLVEQYDGYVNGGNFRWNNVSPENSHTLSFTTNGNYQKTRMINGAQVSCIGTYLLQTDNKLQINSNCNTGTETSIVSQLTSKILILDWSGNEGVIRYRYLASF